MKFRKILSTVFAFTLTASLAGCGGSGSAAETSSSTTAGTGTADTMNIEMTTAPVGLHPLKTNDSASTDITSQLFETLYVRSLDGTSYEPLLASDMPSYSDDHLTATIPLRENVKFGDGTPFTAEAVGYMIDSLKDESYGSQRPSIVESIDSYDIVDDHHIALHLAYDDGVLVAKLAHTNGAIVNPELDKTKDLLVDPTGAGTGPYEFVSAVTGSSYDLKAKDDYWGSAPEIRNIHVDVVSDEATAVARLQTGEADLYTTLQIDSYDTADAIEGYTAVNQVSSAVGYLALRSREGACANELMANKDFRTALLQAVDFDKFVDSVMAGQATPSHSIVNSTLVGYTKAMEDSYIGYDPDAAKKTIDENGWSGQTVTLRVPTRPIQQNFAAYVQSQLAEVGITVNIVSEEWATFLTNAKDPTGSDMVFLTWSNVTGDGQQMLDPNFSTKNGTRVLYNNAEFDAAEQASAQTTVQSEREQHMLDAVNKIQGDAVAQPIYNNNSLFCYNSTKFADVDLGMDGLYRVQTFKLAK